ncbi:hypothetical protein [Streptosporangium saharense]|uniref:Uncharacterized protein n=1 Tax=Streptosporangium saharense TaxID=1706840 RepID=A0A7W7VSY7_9ACTN|nr:hypothetical protein [Streptosporangium saharense]MBB4920895.1 hypothetical protein [Streptosporangium saharense]
MTGQTPSRIPVWARRLGAGGCGVGAGIALARVIPPWGVVLVVIAAVALAVTVVLATLYGMDYRVERAHRLIRHLTGRPEPRRPPAPRTTPRRATKPARARRARRPR